MNFGTVTETGSYRHRIRRRLIRAPCLVWDPIKDSLITRRPGRAKGKYIFTSHQHRSLFPPFTSTLQTLNRRQLKQQEQRIRWTGHQENHDTTCPSDFVVPPLPRPPPTRPPNAQLSTNTAEDTATAPIVPQQPTEADANDKSDGRSVASTRSRSRDTKHDFRKPSPAPKQRKTCSWESCPERGVKRWDNIFCCRNCGRWVCVHCKEKPNREGERKCGRG